MITNQPNLDIANPPLVSIIMPVYNREKFLQDAINSIQAQTFTNWELIIVDDGSSDNSVSLLKALTSSLENKVIIIEQANQGPAGARNNGFKHAQGSYIAFFDSDDLWKKFHLTESIKAFQKHPALSWVYSACERVNYFTKELLLQSTFYTEAKPNKLFEIAIRYESGVYELNTQKAILLQLTSGLDNGLQNSVLHRKVLDTIKIPNFRVGEDRLFIIMVLKHGFRMGFIDKIHVTYHVHDENISDTNKDDGNYDKRIEALERLITAKQALPNIVSFTKNEMQAYKKTLAKEIYWELGYALYQQSGQYSRALRTYLKAIKIWPKEPKYYKTFLLTLLKYGYQKVIPR